MHAATQQMLGDDVHLIEAEYSPDNGVLLRWTSCHKRGDHSDCHVHMGYPVGVAE